ncbi:hypothetical protein [Chlamydiifrater phoenicopteri]|uniref:hypothetical protein n=1 Tax=Chlamydiifrater phoenicopteri TaxID=2681469 RepID=UPI001BCDDB68|nr:hypothetical protein [Chlamydiifrater phoenicopteri]
MASSVNNSLEARLVSLVGRLEEVFSVEEGCFAVLENIKEREDSMTLEGTKGSCSCSGNWGEFSASLGRAARGLVKGNETSKVKYAVLAIVSAVAAFFALAAASLGAGAAFFSASVGAALVVVGVALVSVSVLMLVKLYQAFRSKGDAASPVESKPEESPTQGGDDAASQGASGADEVNTQKAA